MATKCTLIVLEEDADGIRARLAHWDGLGDDSPIPPFPVGLWHAVKNNQPTPNTTTKRTAVTRTLLKSMFNSFVDSKYTNTPA